MIHKTKGIVLRTVKYGETSVIAKIFTELFGIQSYMVNGVRTKRKSSKAHFFQPSSMLDLEVYHSDLKNLQRIKELKWSYLYRNILSDVSKNAVALYMVELLYKCLKEPEQNIDLYSFCEDAFTSLDTCSSEITANFPLYFSIQLPWFFGFSLQDNHSSKHNVFDPAEGNFVQSENEHSAAVNISTGNYIAQVIRSRHPEELKELKLNKNSRKQILLLLQNYYAHHFSEFGTMNTLPVLHEIF